MKTKFAIGCLVQWYECYIVEEYVKSLKSAIDNYDGEVLVDFTVVLNEDLEKCEDGKKDYCVNRIKEILKDFPTTYTDDLYTIADYRREFNERYCDDVDVIVWGESDSLLPKQMFVILNDLHQHSLQNNNPKYLAFFGGCKMWDDSWKPIEHNDFTDKQHSDNKGDWWSVNYTMTIDEMNKINEKVSDLDVRVVSPHKFNGCGLVISSEVIRAGVNIPRSVFFIHEDTSFMLMTNKVLGDIPQYIIKNVLLVHNRKAMNKRKYIKGESGNTIGEMRKSNDWYSVANKMSEQNCHNIFNNNYKSFTWEDVWKTIK